MMCLETELRTKRNPQVVLCTAGEIDFVAYFGAHSQVAPETLDTDARINREAGISGIDVPERLRQGLVIGAEIYKSYFAGGEQIGAPASKIKLGTEKAVQRTSAGSGETSGRAIVEKVGLVPFEVVSNFGFDTGPGIHIEASPAAKTDEVDGAALILIEPVVLREATHIHVIFVLSKKRSGRRDQCSEYCYQSH